MKTPFGTLQSPLRYAGIITAGTAIPPVASYDPIKGVGYINNRPVSRFQYISLLQALKKDTEGILKRLLLGVDFEWNRPDTLDEQVGSRTRGYSYLRNNPFFSQFRTLLPGHIAHTDALSRRFLLPFAPGGTIEWNKSAILQWLMEVDQLSIHLACLFYFLAGQPPRMPELLSMRLYEGSKGQRNLYLIENELVWFVKYTKSESVTGMPFPVIRVAPRFLRDLVEHYVALLRPLQLAFSHLIGRPIGDHHQFLFLSRSRVLSPDTFSTRLKDLSSEYVSQRWGVRAWRQYIIVLSHHILPKSVLEAPLLLTAVVAQASHRATAGQQHYNQQAGTTFSTVNSGQFRQFFAASVALQEALGFPHPTLSEPEQQQATTLDHKHAGSLIVSQIVQSAVPQLVEGFLASVLKGRTAETIADPPLPVRFLPLDVSVTPQTLWLLQKLYKNPRAQFRSPAQGQSAQYLLEGHRDPLVIVHPLGSGKTAIVHLTMVANPDKITLMLVPLVSLAHSAETNARQLGLTAQFVRMEEKDPFASFQMTACQLILMTYDRFVYNHGIQQWLMAKARAGILERVVIDEAHCILFEDPFRQAFSRVYREVVGRLPVPLVLLTGTLPPRLLPALQTALYLHPGRTVYVSRQPSHVAHLAYAVSPINAKDRQIPAFCQWVQATLVPELKRDPSSRVLLFCMTISFAEKIAETLGTPVYYSKLEGEVKATNLDKWMDKSSTSVENVRFARGGFSFLF